MFFLALLVAFISHVESLKSSMEIRAMMEMEASHFLDKVHTLTYDMAENRHPSSLDRDEDLSQYLSKVQSSVVNNIPHLDASHSIIDMIGHSLSHRVFDKIHSFVEIAESLKGQGCETQPTIGDRRTNPVPAVKELQSLLKGQGQNPRVIDGLWGKNTRNAVKSFQASKGLTADGIAGKKTWGKLCGHGGSSDHSSQSGTSTSTQQHHSNVATVSETSQGGSAVIDAARGLRDHLTSSISGYGTTFNGYGAKANQYVCTTYVSKVLRDVGFPFVKGDEVDKNINIRGLDLGSDPATKLGELVRAGNEKTKGVVHALTTKKWGTEITDLDTVQPGDLCQYWYGSKQNKGHVVIVDTAINKGSYVKVIGSHGSTNGVSWIHINLHTMKKAYCVRPHEVDTDGVVSDEIEDEEDDIGDIAGQPTMEEELVENMKEHAKECTECKNKVSSKDGDPNEACANECAVAPANVNSASYLENMVKTFFDGITTVHSGNTCEKFEMNWECLNAYFPHLVIVGASGNVGPMVGGAEVVTDYNAGSVGVFLYGGLTVGTGMMGVSGGFYAGVGYKGVQSEACCKNPQDFGTQQCVPDPAKTPCPLRDSYKGYFLGGDVSVAIPPFGAGVLVAMSAGAVFEDANLDEIDAFSKSLLSESGDIRDTDLSHVGNQAIAIAEEASERDPLSKTSLQDAAIQSLKNAGCFVTKPLPHLTKTIAFSFDAQAKEVAVGVNLATTHYKHVGSMKCWDQDGGGPLCFAAALAISPPWDIPPNPVGTTIKVIGFSMFMQKWCEKNAENRGSATCKIWFKLKDYVTTKMQEIKDLIKWLTSEMAKHLEDLKIVWDSAMEVLDQFKEEFDRMIAEAKEAADKWVAENIGENLDNWRATLGDVSPEMKENVVYLPSEYVDRVGTYVKFLSCTFDNNEGFVPDSYLDWNEDPEAIQLKAPYWTCRSCNPSDRSDCSSSKNTEVGFEQDGVGEYAWRPNEATIMERGFGMFFENSWFAEKRSFVKCHLNNRVRVGESVMSLITLGSDIVLPNTEIWIEEGSIEESTVAEVYKFDDDGNKLGSIGTCNVMYHHKKTDGESRFKENSMLRHNRP